MPSATASSRKKINFMIDKDLLVRFHTLVPAGQRSDFVNAALQNALREQSRQDAIKMLKIFREEGGWAMTDEKVGKEIAYGRK